MRLESIIDKHAGAIVRLRESYVLASATSFSEKDRMTAFVCIEAVNYWSKLCRKTIECVMTTGTLGGNAIGWNTRPGDWLELACRSAQGWYVPGQRRKEPKWHETANIAKVAVDLGFSNEPKIRAAVSCTTRVLVDLPCARNFYAHRNESTKLSANRLFIGCGVPVQGHPTNLLSSRLPSGRLVLEDWLLDLELIIRLFY